VIRFFSLGASPDQTVSYLWFRVIFWCGVIALLSSLPSYTGKEANFETLRGILDFMSRKLAHLFEYAVLTIYLFRAVEKSWAKSFRWHTLISFAFSILFAMSDEWHQTFVLGRSGSMMDVFVDSVGSFLGCLYCLWRS